MSYKRIGGYIRLVDKRNNNLAVTLLRGVSTTKQLIESVANMSGVSLHNYKVVGKRQFVYVSDTSRSTEKIGIALNTGEACIVSSIYSVFEVINDEELLPEYLMMWFTRSEFDREACFHAVGGVRGSLEWEDFENLQLPIPHPDKQKEIGKEYNTIVNRIALNNQHIKKLEETAQAIFREWFVDFEFPNENGKPYKSNGGEMV